MCWLATAHVVDARHAVHAEPRVGARRGGHGERFPQCLAHPFSGLDHVVAMVAVGLWGVQLKKPAIWMLPVAFPVVMAFGGMLGVRGLQIPGVETGIAVSAIVLGGAVIALIGGFFLF